MPDVTRGLSPASRLVIFDCDGVLVDSEALENQLLIDMAASCGVRVDAEIAHVEFVGRKLADCVSLMEQSAKRELPPTFIDDFRGELSVVMEKELQAVPGVHSALEQISELKCVASNAPRNKIEQALQITRLRDFFESRIFSAYEVAAWKPEPDLFLHAAQSMGVRPEACVVVEDSRPGIEAALAAGMRVIAYAPNGDAAPGAVTIRHMDQLPNALARARVAADQ